VAGRAGPGVDEVVDEILSTFPVITVVGASAQPGKAAHDVPAHMQRHGWRLVPVNPRHTAVLGEPAYPSLADLPEPPGLVNVFRPAAFTPAVARDAVAAGARALWLQLGIFSADARAVAEEAGLLYVEDRCILVEQRRRGWDAPARGA
jgi:predicted CoA-binding protein